MYVCICNALKERHVASAIDSLASPCASSVYREAGVKPRCGKCRESISSMIETRKSMRAAGRAIAAE